MDRGGRGVLWNTGFSLVHAFPFGLIKLSLLYQECYIFIFKPSLMPSKSIDLSQVS
jgi:hypothetical protein